MEESNPNNDDDDQFFDALDDFSFYDCIDTVQSELSTSHSTTSHLETTKHEPHDSLKPRQSPESPSPSTLHRRRSLSHHNYQRICGEAPKDPNLEFPVSAETNRTPDITNATIDRRYKFYHSLRENKKSESTEVRIDSVQNSANDQNNENSTVTTANDDRVDNSVAEFDDSSPDGLVFLAGLVIKAIGFQVKLLIRLFTFPIWLSYYCYVFVIDPFRIIRRGRRCLKGKALRVWSVVCECISPLIYDWLKEHKSMWKLALRFGWGFLWAAYVCIILCGFLVSSFVISGLVMRYVVEEPIQMKEELNFDYTKNTPVAFVPVISCPGTFCGVDCREKIEVRGSMGSRVIPPNHKLQVTISLTLPESDYNRNLGIFQVRVDFLSAYGKVIASSSHPCMLQFKSQPIRLLLTFLDIVPLVAGYLSESQTLNIKMRGFIEGDVPTSCLRVKIEQRAEFRPGAGIPEIYAASLILESELPLFKRIIWYWKKTLFVWISMVLFMMELLLALVCCRSIIIPRVRTRDGSAHNSTPHQPVQRS